MKLDLDELYRLHMNDIYRYLFKLTRDKGIAEDLTQETFTRAFQFLNSYQDEKVRPWLFKVAYHTFVDWYRRNKLSPTLSFLYNDSTTSLKSKDPEEMLLKQEFWTEFLERTQVLPSNQQHALLLYYFHQLTYEEIAKILELTLQVVKSSIYRGKQKLRILWKDAENES